MPDDVNFVELAALMRIKPDSVAERFGGLINSSFFDASNILATLKQKGLVDFMNSFPGQSAITVTDIGKKLLGDAEAGSGGDFDSLDLTVLTQLSSGKRTVQDLSGAINIRPSDLAMHLYKLSRQQYLLYEFRNGIITITLTEKGFMQAKNGVLPPPMAQQAAAGQQNTAPQGTLLQPVQTATEGQQQITQTAGTAQQPGAQTVVPNQTIDINQLEANIKKAKMKRRIYTIVIAVVIVAVVLAIMFVGLDSYASVFAGIWQR
jgi:DNA-binding MarR family transcriptional regulator